MFTDYQGIINNKTHREAYYAAYKKIIEQLNQFEYFEAAEFHADNLYFIKEKLERLAKPDRARAR